MYASMATRTACTRVHSLQSLAFGCPLTHCPLGDFNEIFDK